jgi:hypothetical protein
MHDSFFHHTQECAGVAHLVLARLPHALRHVFRLLADVMNAVEEWVGKSGVGTRDVKKIE